MREKKGKLVENGKRDKEKRENEDDRYLDNRRSEGGRADTAMKVETDENGNKTDQNLEDGEDSAGTHGEKR